MLSVLLIGVLGLVGGFLLGALVHYIASRFK